MKLQHSILMRGLLLALLGWVTIAANARAVGVTYLEHDLATGFDTTWSSPELALDESPGFLTAGSGGGSWDVTYDLDQCLLLNGVGECQAQLPAGTTPYTSIVTLTLTGIGGGVEQENEELLIMLMGMRSVPANYALADVAVLLDTEPGETPLIPVVWNAYGGSDNYQYLGFILEVGQSAIFRYTVEGQLEGGTPVFITNATYDFTPVPEPGSALLLAVGLGGFALRRRHARSRR